MQVDGMVKVRLIIVLDQSCGVFLMSGQSLVLESSCHSMICLQGLLPVLRDKLKRGT